MEDSLKFKEFTDRYQRSFYHPLSRRVMGELSDQPAPVVIDLGTGPGYLTRGLAEQLNGHVESVDINPAMHQIAREVLADAGLKASVRLVIADVHELPYPEAYADAIVFFLLFIDCGPAQKETLAASAVRLQVRRNSPSGRNLFCR